MRKAAWILQNALATFMLKVFCSVMHPKYSYDGCSGVLSNALFVYEARNRERMNKHIRCKICTSREHNTFGWSADWEESDYTRLYYNGHLLYGYPHESFQLDDSDCWSDEQWKDWHNWLAQVADECEWSAIWNVMYV